MNGKLVAGFIVIVGAVAGVAMYYLQEYAYYTKAVFKPGAEIALTLISSGQPEAILAEGVEGIDADSAKEVV